MPKVLDPSLKNTPTGYLAPVRMTGTYDHPTFGVDLGDPKNKGNQPANLHTLRPPDQAKQ